MSEAQRSAALRPFLIFLLALTAWLVSAWTYGDARRFGFVELQESRALDRYFLWRQQWKPAAVDPRICLITVDRESERELGKPSVLWTEDFARLSQRLLDAGALAVGIDFAGDPENSKSPESFRQTLAQGYASLQDVLLSNKLVLIENDVAQTRQSPAWPDSVVAFADDGRNSCVANLMVDPDGTVRRIPLTAVRRGETWVNHTFALRLAEIVEGRELELRDEVWSWKGGARLQGRGRSMRINYPGPPGVFPSCSLAQVLPANSDLSAFQGKVVLIVPNFLFDLHPTPFVLKHRNTMGGEIHAAALNTALTQAHLCRPGRNLWATVVAGLAALAATAGAYLSPVLAVAAVVGLGVAYLFGAFLAFVNSSTLLPLWSAGVVLALGMLVGLVVQFLAMDERRRGLRQLLGRMVSHQVADAMLAPRKARAERRQITLLFSDINGFTPACERLSPEQVLSMLNAYFQEMVSLIDRNGGYVKQFVGDEIMAIYGAPRHSSSHPRDAVHTAIQMLDKLDQLRLQDPQGQHGFYSVKIGINTGEAVLGSVGSDERWEYAAVGDDVNLAARLESLTTKLGVDILVSKFTKELVGTLPTGWRWRSMGLQQFKGKTSELEVYTLERVREGEA